MIRQKTSELDSVWCLKLKRWDIRLYKTVRGGKKRQWDGPSERRREGVGPREQEQTGQKFDWWLFSLNVTREGKDSGSAFSVWQSDRSRAAIGSHAVLHILAFLYMKVLSNIQSSPLSLYHHSSNAHNIYLTHSHLRMVCHCRETF